MDSLKLFYVQIWGMEKPEPSLNLQKADLHSLPDVLSGSTFHVEPSPRRWMVLAVMLAVFVLSLTACVSMKDPEASQEQAGEIIATLSPGQIAGQVFVSRRANLDGINLWLGIPAEERVSGGMLIVQLFHNPGDKTPLTVVTVPLRNTEGASQFDVTLPAQPGPAGQNYFITFYSTLGTVQVFGNRDDDVYPAGRAYLDETPLSGDIAFRLAYDYGRKAVWDDFLAALPHSWLALPLLGILILPGWAALSIMGFQLSNPKVDLGEFIALAIGVSLAIIPLVMAWTTVFHLPWNRSGLVIALLILLGVIAYRWPRPLQLRWNFDPHSLGLVAIFSAALAIRLIMVRDLAAPAWVDAVHHGVITRLILEHGSYPENYLPYLDISGARYHPGFHSLLASFIWLTGMEMKSAMQLLAQVLNACSVFAVYLFTVTFTGNRTAGLLAAALTAFFTPMPAYYASWGRYTQLAGLLILPAAFALVTFELNRKEARTWNWKSIGLAAAVCSGLFLTHYRVILFIAALLAADFFSRLLTKPTNGFVGLWLREIRRQFWNNLRTILLVAGISLLLLMVWLPPTLATMVFPRMRSLQPTGEALFSGFAWPFLLTAQGKTTLYLAGLGILLSAFRKPRFAVSLILWVALLFLLSNLETLGLFRSFINNLSVEITLFIPISALGGVFLAETILWINRWIPVRWQPAYFAIILVSGIFGSVYAARQLVTILNPITFLDRQADHPALAWIQEHVPLEETILINPFAWGYGLYAGNDGGYWITPITGRKTFPPPVLYGFDTNAARHRQISQFNKKVIEYSQDPQGLYDLLEELQIQYIYIGARGGVLSPRLLQESSLYEVIYHQGPTWVLKTR